MKYGPKQSLIAGELNLAIGTVSRALRNKPGIDPATRERIVQTARKHGYTLRPRKRSIVSTKSKASYLGVLVQNPEHRWSAPRFMTNLSAAAAKMGISLIVHHVAYDQCAGVLKPLEQPPAMRDGLLRGLFLIHRWPDEVVQQLARHYACVSLVHSYPAAKVDVIDMDHRAGMCLLAEHLQVLGHKKIGFLGVCPDNSWARARFAGYIEAMIHLGLPIRTDLFVPLANENFDEHLTLPEKTLQHVARLINEGVSAWMCANEWTGYLLARELKKSGLKIGQDVSITGFDNTDIIRDQAIELTSVGFSMDAFCREAIQRLHHRLANPDEQPRRVAFVPELTVGKSTGPAGAC